MECKQTKKQANKNRLSDAGKKLVAAGVGGGWMLKGTERYKFPVSHCMGNGEEKKRCHSRYGEQPVVWWVWLGKGSGDSA